MDAHDDIATPLKKVSAPSQIEKIECALVEHLKENVAGSVKVDPFPADPGKYDFAGLDAAILVHYSGSRFSPREGPTNPNQTRRMNFALVVLVRALTGEHGSYRILEDVRQAVQGEVFAGAGPAEIESDTLIEESQGLWRWETIVGLNTPAVARDRRNPTALMRPHTTTLNSGA